ncbi:hypothetical protein STAFG_7983 [Streptomyces afghaniensis 772]|uniref:Uncharacterized protein n=1 Tax=Streptomyces afghaniensis 772 TaxID=1283301 RepID=S4MEV8_9ACTN|nr:hypothetical protein STAFG_7983 [Streptomyces afghaniensis 772]
MQGGHRILASRTRTIRGAAGPAGLPGDVPLRREQAQYSSGRVTSPCHVRYWEANARPPRRPGASALTCASVGLARCRPHFPRRESSSPETTKSPSTREAFRSVSEGGLEPPRPIKGTSTSS